MVGFSIGATRAHPGVAIRVGGPSPRLFDFSASVLPGGTGFTRAGPALAYAATGALVSHAADQPRFDHDPASGAPNGLLLEPAATNIVPHSVADASFWTADSCAATDLSLNALGLFPGVSVASTGVPWSRLKANITLTNGGIYAIACFFRQGSSSNARVAISGSGGETWVAGPVGALANTRSDLGSCSGIAETVLADGMTRRVTFTYTSAVSGSYQIGLGPQSSTAAEDIVLLGIQVEIGTAFTSFIATSAGPTVRLADSLELTGLSGTYDLVLEYSDGPDLLIPAANISPGYTFPPTGRHLLSVLATPV